MISANELRQLLSYPESPNLDFKRKFYSIYDSDQKVKAFQRDELIKDILALANNNTTTAGEKAYLIIGADDKFINGSRKLYDVDVENILARDLLDIINPATDPPLTDITIDFVELDGKRLMVITILPDPYLHETRRQLQTGNKTYYCEHVVFIRNNESVQIASAKERSAIQELRRKRVTEAKMPFTLFGAILGVSIGGPLSVRIIEKSMPNQKSSKVIGGIIGTIVFGWFGAVLSDALKTIVEIKTSWYEFNTTQKLASIFFIVLFPLIVVLNFTGIFKRDR